MNEKNYLVKKNCCTSIRLMNLKFLANNLKLPFFSQNVLNQMDEQSITYFLNRFCEYNFRTILIDRNDVVQNEMESIEILL